MYKNTSEPNQANPVMSVWLLRVGVFQDSCVIVLHISFSHHDLSLGSLKWDIRQCEPHRFCRRKRADSVSRHALGHQREQNCCAVGETVCNAEQTYENNRSDPETG